MADVVDLRDPDSPFENNMLHGEVVIDAWLILRSQLSPEEAIDLELAELKRKMLEQFYRRFPEQRK